MKLSNKIIRIFIQLFKYFWVSLISAIVDYSTCLFAHEALGINEYIANTIAFILGLITNYTLATIFVFKYQSEHSIKEFVFFSTIGLAGLAISNTTIYVTMTYILIPLSIAKILAIMTTFFWNFTLRKILLFNKVKYASKKI